MSPGAHAVLSPSSSERWISCPASVRVVAEMGPKADSGSVYAQEGTLAHALGELKILERFGHINRSTFRRRRRKWLAEAEEFGLGEDDLLDMERHTDAYVELVADRAALYPDTAVFAEQRFPTGVPESWGTSDTVLVSPVHVEIIDLKYGQGVRVDAAGNPQLRLYGCGALDQIGDLLGEVETVRITVFQPRLDHVSTEEMTADELRAWRETVAIPAAELALGEDAPFGPSEEACRWCPAAGLCRARIEKMTQEDFGRPPDLVTPDELGELLPKLPDIKRWLSDVETAALDLAYSQGQDIPGWKVVLSGGRRTIRDESLALNALEAAGFKAEEVSATKMATLGHLEKLVGKDKLPDILGDLLVKGEGRPALVPDSDRRLAINPNSEAKKDFL